MNKQRNAIMMTGLVAVLAAGTAGADIVAGVDGAAQKPAPPASSTRAVQAAPAGAVTINFDEMTATCLWNSTPGPLTDEYASLGVTFSGPADGDGAGVIDECGSFGVTGQSSPNFLATNNIATYAGGGTPTGPVTMTFADAVSHVQINGGIAAITMECFSGQQSVGSDSIPLAAEMATLVVSATSIDSCVLSWQEQAAVLDDLAFVTGPIVRPAPVPSLSAWSLVLLLLAIGGTAVLARRHV